MEFLGLESERGLALRIAVVPSGKDNLVYLLEGHIRAPRAQQLKLSTDSVIDRQDKETGTQHKDQLIFSCLDGAVQLSLMRNAQHSLM